MKILLIIVGVLFGLGGLVFNPQGFVGLAFMLSGAVFFAVGGVIEAVQELSRRNEERDDVILNALKAIHGNTDCLRGREVE
jgi:hypothetical protein